MKDTTVEIRGFLDLEDAEQRMNEARLAVINEIDRPGRNDRKYRHLLIDLDQSIEWYVAMVQKRLNGLYWRSSGIRRNENQSQPARRKSAPPTRQVANGRPKSESV